jgi:TrmH family RNA methyltransferase
MSEYPKSVSIDIVDSLTHPQALTIRQLLDRSARKTLDGLILIDDEENILEAVRAGVEIQSLFYAGEEIVSDELRSKVSASVPFYEVAKRTNKKLFENDKLTRVFAIAQAPPMPSWDTLKVGQRDLVVLDKVNITGNIGAIIRTSVALNAGGIVLLDTDDVDVYDRRVIRASRGYVFALPVMSARTDDFIRFCMSESMPLVVTMANVEMKIDQLVSMQQRIAIVFGSEKEGCSPALARAASHRVEIPINPTVESLNVSASAAIALFCRFGFNHKSL